MIFFIFYIFNFIIIQTGYFLGSTTKEELNEISNFTKKSIFILKQITYILLASLYFNTIYILAIAILYILYIISKTHKDKLLEFHNIILLGFILNLLHFTNENFIYLFAIFSFSQILENSFKKFNIKKISYELIIYLIIYFIFSIFF